MLIVEGSSIAMISHHFGLPFAVSCIGISIALAIVGRCLKGVPMVPQIVGMLTLAYAKSIIEYLVPEVSETILYSHINITVLQYLLSLKVISVELGRHSHPLCTSE